MYNCPSKHTRSPNGPAGPKAAETTWRAPLARRRGSPGVRRGSGRCRRGPWGRPGWSRSGKIIFGHRVPRGSGDQSPRLSGPAAGRALSPGCDSARARPWSVGLGIGGSGDRRVRSPEGRRVGGSGACWAGGSGGRRPRGGAERGRAPRLPFASPGCRWGCAAALPPGSLTGLRRLPGCSVDRPGADGGGASAGGAARAGQRGARRRGRGRQGRAGAACGEAGDWPA